MTRPTLLVVPVAFALTCLYGATVAYGALHGFAAFGAVDNALLMSAPPVWWLYTEAYLDLLLMISLIYAFVTFYIVLLNGALRALLWFLLSLGCAATQAFLLTSAFVLSLLAILLLLVFPEQLLPWEGALIGWAILAATTLIAMSIVIALRYQFPKRSFARGVSEAFAAIS